DWSVAKHVVHRSSDSCHGLRVVGQDLKSADQAHVEEFGRDTLLEVLPVEIQDVVVFGRIENRFDGQLQIDGEDIADQRDSVARLEIQAVGEGAPDEAGPAVALERELL